MRVFRKHSTRETVGAIVRTHNPFSVWQYESCWRKVQNFLCNHSLLKVMEKMAHTRHLAFSQVEDDNMALNADRPTQVD